MPRNTDIRILRAAVWSARHRAAIARPAASIEALLERAFYRRGFPLHYRVGGQGQQAFPSISEIRNSGKQQSHLKWITIGGADEGDQRHVGGSHVLIDGDGNIVDGPAALQGRSLGGGSSSSGGHTGGGHAPAKPPEKKLPEMPEDKPAVADTVGDRNAAAGQQLDRLPEPLREVTSNLHGTRENRKTGRVSTDQVDAGVAQKMADYLRKSLGRDDGFGRAVDLGGEGLGYVSPAGAVTVRPPAKRGEPWTVGYEADPARVEQLAKASPQPAAKPAKEKATKAKPAKTYDDDFDTSNFGDDGASTPAIRKTPGGRLGEAIRQTAAEHGLDPGDLADAVDFVWEEKRKVAEDREAAKAAARKKTGLSAADVNRLSNAGHDYASLKAGGVTGAKLRHFDAHAQELAREFPELGLGDPDNPRDDFAARLWQVLGEGKQPLPARTDPEILDEAANLAKSAAYAGYGDEQFAEPFRRERERVARFSRWRAGRRLAEQFSKSFANRWSKLRYAKFDKEKHPRGDDGEFELKNDPPKKKMKIENEPTKQKRMFDGMDALPGQQDLFDDDSKLSRETYSKPEPIHRRTYTTFQHPEPGYLDLRRLALHEHDRPHEGSHELVETYKDEFHRTLVPSEAAGLALLARRVKELKQAGWRQSEKYQRAEEPMPYSEAEAADAAERTDADHIADQFASAFRRRGYVEKYAGPQTTIMATPVHETLAKVSQTMANYKPAFGSARCAACAHYREHACEIVDGRIEPNDVCDFFTPEREDRTERISEQYARQAAAAQLGQWVETYAKRKPAAGQHHLWTEADEEKHPRGPDGKFGEGNSEGNSGNAIALHEPKSTMPDSGQEKGPPASETAAAGSNLDGGQTMSSVAKSPVKLDRGFSLLEYKGAQLLAASAKDFDAALPAPQVGDIVEHDGKPWRISAIHGNYMGVKKLTVESPGEKPKPKTPAAPKPSAMGNFYKGQVITDGRGNYFRVADHGRRISDEPALFHRLDQVKKPDNTSGVKTHSVRGAGQ